MTSSDPGWDRAPTELFDEWARGAVRKLPLYRRLCEGAALDREVAERLLLAPDPSQRIPNLLLAAVHDVVLSAEDDADSVALRAWYASAVDEPRPVGDGADDPWPHFRSLALQHEGVAELLRTRATQTNEVGRCATILLALAGPMAEGRSMGLVEVGASAGLNLLLDGYGYRYHRAGAGNGSDAVVAGGAPLVLDCLLRGPNEPPVPPAVPVISSRVGVDRTPVDLADPDRARWLVACQWPDQPKRVIRARTAVAMAHGRRPRVVVGDAVDDVARLVAEVPESALPVVFSTWVMSYLSAERQRSFVSELDHVGRERDLSLVFAEQPGLVPGLAEAGVVPGRPDGAADGSATALVRVDWRDGQRRAHRLADQHPHGSWVEWLG